MPSQDVPTPVKRSRGRPRKHPLPAQQQAQSAVQGLSTRRTNEPDVQAAMKRAKLHQEPHIFSSPVSSSPPPGADNEVPVTQNVKHGVFGASTSTLNAAPPKARRQIVQVNDDISAIVRQMSG